MKSTSSWPKISIVIFTFNDPNGVKKSLESVKKQIYPQNKIEIIAIDNASKDNSAQVAKLYTPHVWIDSSSNGPAMRANGMRRATGDYIFMILEQDMELKSKYFLRQMVKPLLENPQLSASFTREYPRSDQPWVTRFISYDSCQRDPLFQFITPSVEQTFVEHNPEFTICYFRQGLIPPYTHMLFRKSLLVQTHIWTQIEDFDQDTIATIVEAGYHLFAYVPSAGLFHHHARNLGHLLSKRTRNLNNHYFPHGKTTKYSYLDNKTSLPKIIFIIIFANMILPAALRGLIRFVKYRDWALLMDPIVTLAVVDSVLIAFLRDRRGRDIIKSALIKNA